MYRADIFCNYRPWAYTWVFNTWSACLDSGQIFDQIFCQGFGQIFGQVFDQGFDQGF